MTAHRYRAIFFDFDGVLVESVDIKTRAFAKLFEKEGEGVVRQVVAYHLRHGGLSRYEKIRYYYDHLLRRPLSDEQLNDVATAFSRLVVDEVVEAPYVKGALEFLTAFHDRCALYTISGTPEQEMKDIIRRRGMDVFFKGVYGAPRKKDDLVRMIMQDEGYAADEALFVGDALTDLEAAKANSVAFIARVADGSHNFFEGMNLPIISDLTELNPF